MTTNEMIEMLAIGTKIAEGRDLCRDCFANDGVEYLRYRLGWYQKLFEVDIIQYATKHGEDWMELQRELWLQYAFEWEVEPGIRDGLSKEAWIFRESWRMIRAGLR